MSVGDPSTESEVQTSETQTGAEEAEVKRKVELSVQITEAGPCKKHLKVAIPREEIDRQFDESLQSVRREAQVPGFRPGRAPRMLVEKRFRKEVAGQVKSTLLMACMEQIDEDHKINPISQPDLDLEALVLPEDGPLEFEFDVEVRPDFALPDYKSLTVKRPIRKIAEQDVTNHITALRERSAQIVPKLEGGAEIGDFLVADLNFSKGGIALNSVKEIQFRLQPQLRFQDGLVPDIGEVLKGVKPGEIRDSKAQIGSSSPDPALRNQEIDVQFVIHDLKSIRLPELDATYLQSMGFDVEEELRTIMRSVLERRAEFQARQAVRQQIVDQLTQQVPFDLPSELVKRQERTTLRRLVEEMREAGYSDNQLKAREAEIRANAHDVTMRNLKEFFLLSKVAEAEEVKVEDEDIEQEILAMASRADESPRRIRSRLEKDGQLENLSTQVLERKTIEKILDYTTVELEEVSAPQPEESEAVETLDESAGSVDAEAGEAEPGGEA